MEMPTKIQEGFVFPNIGIYGRNASFVVVKNPEVKPVGARRGKGNY
jgi:hypothetical protein